VVVIVVVGCAHACSSHALYVALAIIEDVWFPLVVGLHIRLCSERKASLPFSSSSSSLISFLRPILLGTIGSSLLLLRWLPCRTAPAPGSRVASPPTRTRQSWATAARGATWRGRRKTRSSWTRCSVSECTGVDLFRFDGIRVELVLS